MERLWLALLGCGGIARFHAERVRADGRAEIVALVDRDRTSAESLRQATLPGADVFLDVEAALDTTPSDAAIVCTPTHLHFEHTVCCLDRGLHVLCEKPLAD